MTEYSFPVERGHILSFARAVGEANAAYLDGLLATPTFVQAAAHFDPDWRFRPRPDRPWHGSGGTASGVPLDGQPVTTGLHAEQHFTYHRPVRPGVVLTVRTGPGAQWEKSSPRSGRLCFSETLTHYTNPAGEPMVTARMVKVVRERDPGREEGGGPPATPVARAAEPAPPAEPAPVGAQQRVVIDGLTRTQLVQYAGASGDFNPLHTDEVYAREVAGLPTVFAHGMLTMAATARVITDRFDPTRLRELGVRFRDRVWPGDVLVATAVPDEPGTDAPECARFRISTRNQAGTEVLSGYAAVATP